MNKVLISGGTLKGCKVVNPAHEELGKIEELMIDTANGNIVYAVISFGGFMGFGEKYFAMPWEAFYLDTVEEDKVILSVPKEKLENAPGFDKDNWPDTAQWEFVDQVYSHYGYDSYSRRRPIGRVHDIPTSTLKRSAGLGNSGSPATFEQAGLESNRIKDSGIN